MKGQYRVEPDRAAMEIVHRQYRLSIPLDKMLEHPALAATIKAMSRKHMAKREWFDAKAAAAQND